MPPVPALVTDAPRATAEHLRCRARGGEEPDTALEEVDHGYPDGSRF